VLSVHAATRNDTCVRITHNIDHPPVHAELLVPFPNQYCTPSKCTDELVWPEPSTGSAGKYYYSPGGRAKSPGRSPELQQFTGNGVCSADDRTESPGHSPELQQYQPTSNRCYSAVHSTDYANLPRYPSGTGYGTSGKGVGLNRSVNEL